MPPGCLDEPQGASPTNRRHDVYGTPVPDVLLRGRRFFDGCYGKVAPRVMTSLDHCGTEDLGLAVRLSYGYLLSTTSVLSEAETSFIMIAGLIPQDVSPAPHNLRRANIRRGRVIPAVPSSIGMGWMGDEIGWMPVARCALPVRYPPDRQKNIRNGSRWRRPRRG